MDGRGRAHARADQWEDSLSEEKEMLSMLLQDVGSA